MKDLDDILRLIFEEMKRQGVRQGAIAKKLNKSEAWMSNIINKKRKMTVETLLEIADVLGVEVSSFLSDEKGNTTPKLSFEDYLRGVIRDELEKALKK